MWCRHCGYDISGIATDSATYRCPECGVTFSIEQEWSWHSELQHNALRLELVLFWLASCISFFASLVPIVSWADAWRATGLMPGKLTDLTPLGSNLAFVSYFYVYLAVCFPIVFGGAVARRGNNHVRKFRWLWFTLTGGALLFTIISISYYPAQQSILNWWLDRA